MKKTSFTDEQLLNLVNNTAIKYDRNPDDFTGGSIQITTAYRHKVVNHKVILFFGYTESRNPTSISFEIHEDLIFIWADAIKVKVASMKALNSGDHISELNELMSEPKEKEKRTKKEKEISSKVDSSIVVSRSRARTNHRTNVRTNILNDTVEAIISDLNSICGTKYKHTTKSTIKLINGRLSDGYTIDDFKEVHRKKHNEWHGTEMEKYLCPSTLYRQGNFEKYLNQKITTKKSKTEETIRRVMEKYSNEPSNIVDGEVINER